MSRSDVILTYVPDFLRSARIYKAIIDAEGAEFDLLRARIADVLNQFYIETATWGLDLWEQMLGISTSTGKSLGERRSKVMSKRRGIGTVTAELIKTVAEAYSQGTIDVYINRAVAVNTIFIKFLDERGTPTNIDDLKTVIEEIKPAHLAVIYEYRYLTWDELDTRLLTWDHLDVKNLTWDVFETGSWL